jgi:hypothetical protein
MVPLMYTPESATHGDGTRYRTSIWVAGPGIVSATMSISGAESTLPTLIGPTKRSWPE